MKMVSLASSVSVSIHWDVFTIGMEHSTCILFVYSTCEALTLAFTQSCGQQLRLVPSSHFLLPSRIGKPLLLEAQVSLKDF